MNYSTVRQLIDQLEAFEQETGLSDLSSFSLWLQSRLNSKAPAPGASLKELNKSHDVLIARGIGALYQHAKHYTKTALSDLPLNGLYDFAFLTSLLEHGDLRKSEIIAQNLIEFSPGMEVIRRLIRRNLIEDFSDPNDARSKRVRITEYGRQICLQALKEMTKAAKIVSGHLAEEEKMVLIGIIRKLQEFHQPIWENEHGAELNQIIQGYLDSGNGMPE